MNFPRLVVFGEALTDFIRTDNSNWNSAAGGSCWNVACVSARLGISTGFAGSVSCDIFGDELIQKSINVGLDMRFMNQVNRAPFFSMVIESNPPKYFFIGENSADLAFDPEHLPSGWFDEVEIVYFGSLSLVREPLASRLIEIAEAAYACHKKIVFDPNFREQMKKPSYSTTLRRLVGLATYLKISSGDLSGLFPDLEEIAAIAQIREWNPTATLLITHGESGIELIDGNTRLFQPAFPVDVKDTIGCGDASISSWIASLLERPYAQEIEHLQFAAACSSIVAGQRGSYAPTISEIKTLLRSKSITTMLWN
ncbi:MAG: carbohydrate kinase [Burkholderia sp.]|nr:carbohydrate kinase [Burkholderia sp.]